MDFGLSQSTTGHVPGELIRIDQINEVYERMLKNDVRYCFVIDMQSLKG